MDTPPTIRLSDTARRLLRRLDQQGAFVVFLPKHGAFYFGLGMAVVDPVRQATVDVLVRPGFIVRNKSTTAPTYRISSKGQRFLSVAF